MSKERLWRYPTKERRIARLTRIEKKLVNMGHTPEKPSEAIFNEGNGVILTINTNTADSRYASQVNITNIDHDILKEVSYGTLRSGKEVERVVICTPMTDARITHLTPFDYEIYRPEEIEIIEQHGRLFSSIFTVANEQELKDLITRLKKTQKLAR